MPTAPSSGSPLHRQNSFDTLSYRRNWFGGIAENRYSAGISRLEYQIRTGQSVPLENLSRHQACLAKNLARDDQWLLPYKSR